MWLSVRALVAAGKELAVYGNDSLEKVLCVCPFKKNLENCHKGKLDLRHTVFPDDARQWGSRLA